VRTQCVGEQGLRAVGVGRAHHESERRPGLVRASGREERGIADGLDGPCAVGAFEQIEAVDDDWNEF
jgi:hypothetical protein